MREDIIEGHAVVILQPTMIAVSVAHAYGIRLPRPIAIHKAQFENMAKLKSYITERNENGNS